MKKALNWCEGANIFSFFQILKYKMFYTCYVPVRSEFFSCSEIQSSIVSLAQDQLEIPWSSWMDGSLHLLSDLYPRFMFFCLFKRTNMLCDGPTILHFPKTIVFAFLLSLLSIQFPTCSQIYIKFISDPMAGVVFSPYRFLVPPPVD